MRPTLDPDLQYPAEAILTSEELRTLLRMTDGEWLRLRAHRAWAAPLEDLPPPVLGGHSGSLHGLRWRMADVTRWLDARAAGYRSGAL